MKFILEMSPCVLQRTRGQKRKRVPLSEDREEKPEVSSLLTFVLFNFIWSSSSPVWF